MVVGAHEHQHVVQANTMGLVAYGVRYAVSSQRALLEAEAYRASFELDWWRSRQVPDPATIAGRLGAYGVAPTDIAVATSYLKASAVSIQNGAILNRSTAVALAWLNAHAPELRAP